jgi:hypothetical protein
MTMNKPARKIATRQLELRGRLWPEVKPEQLWQWSGNGGYCNIPKALPIIMAIMDDLADKRVSSVYLELWTRTFDNSFVVLSKPREMAFHAGADGQRGERTWKERVKELARLNFIGIAPGPSGELSYAVIYNPFKVIKHHVEKGTLGLSRAKYTALLERTLEVGANDLNN